MAAFENKRNKKLLNYNLNKHILQIKFFNDPVVCTLQMLDTLEQKDPIHRAEVHCQLAQFLPDIPKVCTHHTLKKKTEQIMYHFKDNM